MKFVVIEIHDKMSDNLLVRLRPTYLALFGHFTSNPWAHIKWILYTWGYSNRQFNRLSYAVETIFEYNFLLKKMFYLPRNNMLYYWGKFLPGFLQLERIDIALWECIISIWFPLVQIACQCNYVDLGRKAWKQKEQNSP